MALHQTYPADRIAEGPHDVGPLSPEVWSFLASAAIGDGWLHPRSSNYTFIVHLECDGGQGFGVYKPEAGEVPLWDFPTGSLYRRETAAGFLSDALGWSIVLPTVVREGEAGVGSLQLYVPPAPGSSYFTLVEEHSETFMRMAVFDVVTNNADRKGGHCILAADGSGIWGVDHGLTFHTEPKLRTVIWDFAGQRVPEGLVEDLRVLREALDAEGSPIGVRLRELLAVSEVNALRRRVDRLVEEPVLPRPYSRRDLPWPWQ